MAKKSKKESKKKSKKGKGGLSDLQSMWDESEPWTGGGGWKPPEGTHEARIVAPSIGKSQGGRMQIDWPFEMITEKFEGKEFHDYQGLETQENLNFVLGRLETLGITAPDDIEDLGSALEEADGIAVRFTCWKDEEFLNMRIDDVLEEDSSKKGKKSKKSKKAKENEDEEPEESDEPEYTKKEIKKMKGKELKKVAKECDLDPDDYDDNDELRDAIIDELEL